MYCHSFLKLWYMDELTGFDIRYIIFNMLFQPFSILAKNNGNSKQENKYLNLKM